MTRERGASDLGPRVAVALVALPVVLVLLDSGGLPFTLLLVVLAVACMHELFEMFADTGPPKLAGFVGVIAVILAAHFGELFHVLLAFVAWFPVLYLLTVVTRGATAAGVAFTVLGVAWVGLALAHAVLLRELPHGAGIIVGVMAGTFIGDSGAYFVGRSFGIRKLAPRISPNKTWEGLVGGLFFAVVGVQAAGFYQDWLDFEQALWVGIGVALAAPVGDLFESFLKREAGTKDTGRLFGAHGGGLDRLDALFFTAVVGYYVWRAVM